MNTVTAKKSEKSEQESKEDERIKKQKKAQLDASLAESEEHYRLNGGTPMDEVFDRIENEIKQKHGL